MSKTQDTETESAKPQADAASPPKRKRVAGVAKFAKTASDDMQGERIAKAMARAGLCSRREAEVWIADGRVSVNGKVLDTPAVTVSGSDRVVVDGQPLPLKERTRLFLYHKPRGLVTTTHDPEGRPTVFESLPPEMPRVVTVGRLDINTEGLLLLTNDGGLARVLELPATGWLRRYRVRAFGEVTKEQLDSLAEGVTIEGISYGPVEATIDTVTGSNVWLLVGLREGKNREVKRILQHLGLTVNRLIRISFGPFQLADLDDGEVREIRGKVLREQLGTRLVSESGADFDAPIIHHIQGGEGEEAQADRAGKQTRSGKPSGEKPARSGGDGPKKRTARTHMEFLGTGSDGSRQARLDRDGKPSVSVKYKSKSSDDGAAPRSRGPRVEKGESRGFAPRTPSLRDRKPVEGPDRAERPARGAHPERVSGDRPERTSDQKRTGRTFGDKPRFGVAANREDRPARPPREGAVRRFDDKPRGPRSDRPAEDKRGDRPMRSEGFRDRPAGGSNRGAGPERGDRPYRSEGAKDRPSGGLGRAPRGFTPKGDGASGPKREGGSRSAYDGATGPKRGGDRPDKPAGARPRQSGDINKGSRPSGEANKGPRGPRTGGSGSGSGPRGKGGPNRGGAGADRRR